ncbi:Phage holin family Hol44, holin superfamily V [Paenibacillus uliginis N3/975]|uniref:Phage holin family Hol44, holin superfamily V n=1 Tax=Paenibacillus uliginis N3/975 TaxID=1313296 RepID=A0A1X7HL88_9BACL|nr:phage holin family protein [Paenibacillus uliginis]SMF88122.1 Phage holin family Hol44, holin superfamily V [Paenibacillus uliginis N3/975]
MEWNMILELIDPRLLIVVVACWVIGFILKKTPKVPDWSIVYIVIVFAVGLTVGLIGWSVEALIQGILAGAFAVFGHQAVKQTKEGIKS